MLESPVLYFSTFKLKVQCQETLEQVVLLVGNTPLVHYCKFKVVRLCYFQVWSFFSKPCSIFERTNMFENSRQDQLLSFWFSARQWLWISPIVLYDLRLFMNILLIEHDRVYSQGRLHEFQSWGAKSQLFLYLYILFGNIKYVEIQFSPLFQLWSVNNSTESFFLK